MSKGALFTRISWSGILVTTIVGLAGGCRPPGESCCTSDVECGSGALCFEGMCASRCLADSQCAVGEQCMAVGACAAPMRGTSPCAFVWPAAFDLPLDGGLSAADASVDPDAGQVTDGGSAFACTDDIFEPNNSFFEATPAPDGEGVELTICSQDRDLFSLSAVRGDEIGASVEYRYEDGDLDLALFYEGRMLEISQDTQNREEIHHFVEQDGVYYFEVYGFPSDVENTYRFRTYRTRAPCETDPFEDNDNADEAAVLTLGEPIDATLCPTDTADFFRLESLERDAELEVQLTYQAPPGMRLSVVSPDGQSFFSESGVGEEMIRVRVPETGSYLVQVSGSVDEGQTGRYRLAANSIAPPCADDFEPNDAPASATSITLPTSVDAFICPADFDYFSLEVPVGRTQIEIFFAGADVFGSVLRARDFELLGTLAADGTLALPIDEETGDRLLVLVGPVSTAEVGLPYTLIIE